MFGRKNMKVAFLVEKKGIRCIFFEFVGDTIVIESEKYIENNLETRVFIEKRSEDMYIDKIVKYMDGEKLKLGSEKISEIYISIQEKDVILRNIRIDSEIKDDRLKKAVEIELEEFIPDLRNKYILNIRREKRFEKYTDVQAVLFPIKYVKLFSRICDKLGIEKRTLNADFDIIGKIIHMNRKDDNSTDRETYIEIRENDIVISCSDSGWIVESYTVSDDEFEEDMVGNILDKSDSIYVYGKSDRKINLFEKYPNIKLIKCSCDVKIKKYGKSEDNIGYINIIGMAVER